MKHHYRNLGNSGLKISEITVDQVHPGRMLGHVVQVRPRLTSVTYRLGETTIRPMTSPRSRLYTT